MKRLIIKKHRHRWSIQMNIDGQLIFVCNNTFWCCERLSKHEVEEILNKHCQPKRKRTEQP